MIGAFLIGAVAGLRAMTPLAVIARAGAGTGWLGSRGAATVLPLLALGELAADKWPAAPSRLEPGGMAARVATGALAGRAVSGGGAGAAAGALGAIVGAQLGYRARVGLARRLGADLPVALIEDAVAVGGAWLLARPPSGSQRRDAG